MQINPLQKTFIEDEFFSMTMQATAQRANLYRPGSAESARAAFRSGLQTRLIKLLEQYRNGLAEDMHFINITALADALSAAHADVLTDGRFRIGTAQKALNLYLKFMWCMGWIGEPPHCPFDAIILQYVPECKNMRWTKLDSLDDYKRIVECSKIAARGKTLALWELDIYNRSQQPSPKSL